MILLCKIIYYSNIVVYGDKKAIIDNIQNFLHKRYCVIILNNFYMYNNIH